MALDHLQSSKAVALGTGPRASKKLDYIRRTGDYARKLDAQNVVAWEGNIPPQFSGIDEFLTGAEYHERKNGTVYREVEFALPEELDPSEQVALAEDIVSQFTERNLEGVILITPYAAAVHNCGGKNPHVHLVRAERHMISGADYSAKDQAGFFKRQNKKAPEKGGLFKLENTSAFRRSVLAWERQTFETISNDHLERAGRSERVDMRSYADRGLDLAPQRHEGPKARAVFKKTGKKSQTMEYNDIVAQRNQAVIEHQRALQQQQPTDTLKTAYDAITADFERLKGVMSDAQKKALERDSGQNKPHSVPARKRGRDFEP